MDTWLFDLGNTRLKFAPLREDGTLGEVQALAHAGVDDLADLLGQALPEGRLAVLSSVGPQGVRETLMLALAERFGRIELAATQPVFDGLRIAYADPRSLGVDRWLALLAVHARRQAPALLVGVGTALTVDLLDADGRHHGGWIAPSPQLMREALHGRARQLPLAAGHCVPGFADTTADALASGCLGAAAGLVQRGLAAAHAQLGATPALLLHGGGASELAPLLPAARLCEGLVLEGLARWALA